MDNLLTLLDMLNAPFIWLTAQNKILALSLLSFLVCAALISCGLTLAKLRLSPLWVLAILVPFAPIVGLWLLAYKKWPPQKA